MFVRMKNCYAKAIVLSVAALLFLSTSQAVAGQTVSTEQSRSGDFKPAKLVFPKDRAFVEIPFEDQNNHIVIDVSINDSAPVKAVIDTGAQGAVLQDASMAEALKLKPSGEIEIRGAGGSGAGIKASVVDHVTFKIGELELSG